MKTASSGSGQQELDMLNIDTQLLLIQLLNQELRKADHRATRGYYEEIKEAKADLIAYLKTMGSRGAKNEDR